MRFVKIPAGMFRMGSTRGPAAEKPSHEVTLTQPFCLGISEVTQKQWKSVMYSSPSLASGDDLPVETVSWDEVHEFLAKLNETDPKVRYRLPTEAQWEYAASNGGQGIYGFGDDEEQLKGYGNCMGSRSGGAMPVGSLKPTTRWGLYDMHGNVAEWVEDDFAPYKPEPVTDPFTRPEPEGLRGRRGGSYVNGADRCRAAARDYVRRGQASFDTGFRVVRDPVH